MTDPFAPGVERDASTTATSTRFSPWAIALRLQLRSLPQFMRAFLLSLLSGKPSYWLEHYDKRRLGLLRRCVEPLANPEERTFRHEFATYCVELGPSTGPRAVAERLGAHVVDDYPFHTWDEWADHAQATGNTVAEIHCLANAWCQLDFRSDLPGSGGWREAWSRWEAEGFPSDLAVAEPHAMAHVEGERVIRLATALRSIGAGELALEAFASWLDLPDDAVYGSHSHLVHVLGRSPLPLLARSPMSARVKNLFIQCLVSLARADVTTVSRAVEDVCGV